VEASAKIIAMPSVDIGMWANAGDRGDAHASMTVNVNLTAEITANFKWGAGDAADHMLDAVPTEDGCSAIDTDPEADDWGISCCGTSGLPFCYNKETCAVAHNGQLDIHFEVEAEAILALRAYMDWGEWGEYEYEMTYYLANNGTLIKDEQQSFFNMYIHLASACF